MLMALFFNTTNYPHIISWESTDLILSTVQTAIIKNKLNGLQKAVNATSIMAEKKNVYTGRMNRETKTGQ